MTNEEIYARYSISTIESYTSKELKKIRALFLECGVAQNDDQLMLEHEHAVNIATYGTDFRAAVLACVNGNSESFGILEEWEYVRDYRYSVIFTTENFNSGLDAAAQFTSFERKCFPFYSGIESPVFWNYNEDIAFLKFNRVFDAIAPNTDEEVRIRYPIIATFHKNAKLIEIRFDTLRTVFIEGPDDFYIELIASIQHFFNRELNCELTPLDLDFLITTGQSGYGGVRLVAQSMRMANGTCAELDSGKNEQYLLPFVGELSDFLVRFEDSFNRVPDLKHAFEDFIDEKNTMSYYPWITLLWENGCKTKASKVKFTFNYCQKDYCLMQHYFSSTLVGMERMNNVVGFIDAVRRNTT